MATINDIITDKILFDKNIIKVIDGIAGSAKSSYTDAKFKGKYKRFTSTVKLMKDAKNRFGCECDTIAGGLFTTKHGKFYAEQREVEADTVVIDEFLQTSVKVFDWCLKNVGKINIVLTTDTRQMLPPEIGNFFLEKFNEFCQMDCVKYVRVKKTYRAANKETEQIFTDLYESVFDSNNMFKEMKGQFKTINYGDMPFNKNNVYLTHTNDIEEFLYRDKDIQRNKNLEFIQKGCIAKKENINAENYPILCQNHATKRKVSNYLQASNVGTVTRYQGSEVQPEQKCFFMIEKNSVVTNREFYTAFTRCLNKDSFTIVICDEVKDEKLTKFMGFPIRKPAYLHIRKEEVPASSLNTEDMTIEKEAFYEVLKRHISEEVFYSEKALYIDGEPYEVGKATKQEKPGKYNMTGLLKKEPDFDYSYMETVYKILEENGIDKIRAPHFCGNDHAKKEYDSYVDLYSAYPHILKYEYAPIDGKIYRKPTKGKIAFYSYEGPFFEKCIITECLKDFLEKVLSKECYRIKFLFCTDCKKGSKLGDTLCKAAYKNVEEKAESKKVHWGYLEKQYMEKHEAGKNTFFVRNENFNHQLLMVNMLSILNEIMLKMAIYLNGKELGAVCVDAVYFNKGSFTINDIREEFEKFIPDYDYRVKNREDDEIIYQSYEPLKTKKQLEVERVMEYKRKKRAEKSQK